MLIPEPLLTSRHRKAKIKPGRITYLSAWFAILILVLPAWWQLYVYTRLALCGEHTVGIVTRSAMVRSRYGSGPVVWFTYPEMPAGMKTPSCCYWTLLPAGEYIGVTYVPHTRLCSLDTVAVNIRRSIFYTVCIIIVLIPGLFVIAEPLKSLYLARYGSAVIGHIVSSSEWSRFYYRQKAWYVTYNFELPDGRKYQGLDSYEHSTRPGVGDDIIILYNPKRPKMNTVYPMLDVELKIK